MIHLIYLNKLKKMKIFPFCISQIILYYLIYFCKSAKVSDAIKCLKVNKYDDIEHGIKVIGDKNKCFEVSKQCCFINITHYYGDYLLKHEYCNYLNVNVSEFQQFLYNLYNDDEMFYANFTAHNLEMYKTIGRNLETKLTDTLNCFIGPKTNEEYSTYVVNNCKQFVNGVCVGVKNSSQFTEFVENFQKNYANAYCNKKEEKQKCIRYDGARANDKMVKPLLDELTDYLQADNDEYKVVNNETNVDINPDEDDDNGENSFLDHWDFGNKTYKNCTARPIVEVFVECPDGYVYQEFISFKLIKILLISLAVILL